MILIAINKNYYNFLIYILKSLYEQIEQLEKENKLLKKEFDEENLYMLYLDNITEGLEYKLNDKKVKYVDNIGDYKYLLYFNEVKKTLIEVMNEVDKIIKNNKADIGGAYSLAECAHIMKKFKEIFQVENYNQNIFTFDNFKNMKKFLNENLYKNNVKQYQMKLEKVRNLLSRKRNNEIKEGLMVAIPSIGIGYWLLPTAVIDGISNIFNGNKSEKEAEVVIPPVDSVKIDPKIEPVIDIKNEEIVNKNEIKVDENNLNNDLSNSLKFSATIASIYLGKKIYSQYKKDKFKSFKNLITNKYNNIKNNLLKK